MGIPITHNNGKYLGIPMVHHRVSKASYSFLIDKVRKKLLGWKARSPSFVGRVSLAQSSLMSLPEYIMQTTMFLISICEEVERLCRTFILGGDSNQRKCHLVAWETICKPNEEGGLGFRWLETLNQCFIMKLGWQLIESSYKLCVHVLKSKYGCGVQPIPDIKPDSRASHVWRSISKVWHYVDQGICWAIQDGNRVRF